MPQQLICPHGHQWEHPTPQPEQLFRSIDCPVCGARTQSDATLAPPAGHVEPPVVAGYEILGELGRGGMGVVYRARHLKLKRLTALKMILAGTHASPQELARFRTEAEAIARLQHPNIVQVYEVGEQEGRPFFALEFIDGGSLAQQLDGTPLPAQPAAQLVETLARAMDYAHQQGIIHRDLKPANILLQTTADTEHTETRPKTRGGLHSVGSVSAVVSCIPRISDFGLAKHLEGEGGQTQSGAIVGTPSYMAPEQALGEKHLGPAADIYSLGAILYELLTGRPPFRAATPLETVLQAATNEPVPPSRLQPKVPRDLETICLECLLKDPARRYARALDLAEDLRRFQVGEPILARPIGTGERAVKWAKRRPALAGLLAVVTLTLLGLLVGGFWFAGHEHEQRLLADDLRRQAQTQTATAIAEGKRAREQEQLALRHSQEAEAQRILAVDRGKLAEDRFDQAQQGLYCNYIALAQTEWRGNNVKLAEQYLDRFCPEPRRRWEWHYLKRLCHLERVTLPHSTQVWSVAFRPPDGKLLATGSGDGIVRLWDMTTGQAAGPPLGFANRGIAQVEFSPDGRLLAAASQSDGMVRVWAADTRQVLWTEANPHETPGVRSLAFSRDGQLLATAPRRRERGKPLPVKLWDAHTGKLHDTLPVTSWVNALAFGPDGRLALGSQDMIVLRRRPAQPATRLLNAGSVEAVAFSPDGKFLASCGHDRLVRLWDAASGALLQSWEHASNVNHLAFSPDGTRLVSASNDYTARIWEIGSRRALHSVRSHGGYVKAVAFSPDSRLLATATPDDLTARVYDLGAPQEARNLWTSAVGAFAFRPGSTQLAVAVARDGGSDVLFLDAATGASVAESLHHPNRVESLHYHPNGEQLVLGDHRGGLRIWDGSARQDVRRWDAHTDAVLAVVFSPDGTRLATGSQDQTARVWNAGSGEPLWKIADFEHAVSSVAFSSDGRRLAVGSGEGFTGGNVLTIRDAASGAELNRTTRVRGVWGVAFSPDGKWLAQADQNGQLRLWPTERGRKWDETTQPRILTGHHDRVRSVTFSPDGSRLATGGRDQTVRLWDVATGNLLLTLRGHSGGQIHTVAFSPDGRLLASTGGVDRVVKIWDGSPAK